MYEHLTPAVLATEAVMTLAAFDGVVVFVEGPRDQILLEGLLPKSLRLIHCVNKDRALLALDEVASQDAINDERKQRIVAIVDSDFDRPLAIPIQDRCFVSDHHDIEIMILESEAFERWLREYCSEAKLAAIGGVAGVRAKLLELGSYLGAMRLYSRRTGRGLDFEACNYGTLVDKQTLQTNPRAFAQSIYNSNRALFPNMNAVAFDAAVAEELAAYQHDVRDLVQGHDMVELLCIMLRRTLASFDAKEASPDLIAKSLRVAYRYEDWRKSGVATRLATYLDGIGRPLLG